MLIVLLWAKNVAWLYVIPPIGLLSFIGSEALLEYSLHHWRVPINLDPLLVCIVAGYIATNHTRNRRKLLHFLADVSPFIFIPFFTLAGANIKLDVVLANMSVAPIVVVVRMFSIFVGSWVGGAFVGTPLAHRNIMWLGMGSQAGMALGLAAEISSDFDDFGPAFSTAIVSIILINLILGPVMTKLSISRAGDAGKGGSEHEDEDVLKQAILVGADSAAAAIAQKLLLADWNVVVFDRSIDLVDRTLAALAPAQLQEHNAQARERADAARSLESTVQHLANEVKNLVTPTNQASTEAAAAAADATSSVAAKRLRTHKVHGRLSKTIMLTAHECSFFLHIFSHFFLQHDEHVDEAVTEGDAAAASSEVTISTDVDAEDDEGQLVGRVLTGDAAAAGAPFDLVEAFKRVSEDLRDPLAAPTELAIVHMDDDAQVRISFGCVLCNEQETHLCRLKLCLYRLRYLTIHMALQC